MPSRTLDQIMQDTLGIKEMVIARLIWEIEELKDAGGPELLAKVAQRDADRRKAQNP
jgi:hypothetical protein